MKVTVITNPKAVETAAFLLNMAVSSLEGNPKLREEMGVTEPALKAAKVFRGKLSKSFIKAAKSK